MTEFYGPTSHRYFSQRLRLHYVDWGNPGAPALLLVHGGRDHCRSWDWVARALRKNFHVVALDLRGHGDSEWVRGGTYNITDYVYDIAQIVHQLDLAPLRIVAHSLGGATASRYAGLYPENVLKLVNIEGFGMSSAQIEKQRQIPTDDRLRGWISDLRGTSGYRVKRYGSIEEASARMQEANPHLTPEQADHLTVHGVNQLEDGSYSWKFDKYVRVFPPIGLSPDENTLLYSRIKAPVLLVRGLDGWTSDPEKDGRGDVFQDARVKQVPNAGHWVHHDQLELFLTLLGDFL
jgi:pimeloyl-ACP methyl ester carboxylesterase